ncbi:MULTISPECIES: hypothetical protein [unclassified Pseudomonas]|jgi:hypothetical protein|nr:MULTISPECIES: hypothetical protein [unclassified Pseudomonas]MBK5549057.1 hypothetical protein [Pseudomonas sp. TH03]MEB0225371.1 hypothetical protein [Pseudomonas sp. 5S1]MEB0298080.1 hypothetical protein [Pseudomonas sp. 10S4]WPX19801.1 hypothetical protein RHM58_07450 [Pseudomonas sp. 10S4]
MNLSDFYSIYAVTLMVVPTVCPLPFTVGEGSAEDAVVLLAVLLCAAR